MQGAVSGITRECGTRFKGAIYWETAVTSSGGVALHHFLLDPPQKISGTTLKARGVELWQEPKTGIWHILDLIGQDHYPNPSDWLEETRRYGVSRKLSPIHSSVDYSKLTAESRIIVAHRRGWVNKYWEYAAPAYPYLPTHPIHYRVNHWECPLHMHNPNNHIHLFGANFQQDSCCAGIWWEDLSAYANGKCTWEPFNPETDEELLRQAMAANEFTPRYSVMHPVKLFGENDQWHERLVKRRMAVGSKNEYVYFAHKQPDHIHTNTDELFDARYETAFIARFPMSRLAVIKGTDASGKSSSETVSRLTDLGLPAEEVDE